MSPSPFQLHADQDAVGAGEGAAVLEERLHERVLQRDQLVEAGVQMHAQRRSPQRQGDQHEHHRQDLALGDQPARDAVDDDFHSGGGLAQGAHDLAPEAGLAAS
jgi:hypothetical protein